MFEYYFLLTKADGDELDVIAGQSGFLPAGPTPIVSEDVQKEVTLARPENEKPVDLPDGYDAGPWLPSCVRLAPASCISALESTDSRSIDNTGRRE